MSRLPQRDRAVVRDLIGAELAARDEAAVAAAIEDLRAGLPAFRRAAATLLAEDAAEPPAGHAATLLPEDAAR